MRTLSDTVRFVRCQSRLSIIERRHFAASPSTTNAHKGAFENFFPPHPALSHQRQCMAWSSSQLRSPSQSKSLSSPSISVFFPVFVHYPAPQTTALLLFFFPTSADSILSAPLSRLHSSSPSKSLVFIFFPVFVHNLTLGPAPSHQRQCMAIEGPIPRCCDYASRSTLFCRLHLRSNRADLSSSSFRRTNSGALLLLARLPQPTAPLARQSSR